MAFEVEAAPAFEHDVEEAFLHISDMLSSPQTAANLLHAIDGEKELLSSQPFIFVVSEQLCPNGGD